MHATPVQSEATVQVLAGLVAVLGTAAVVVVQSAGIVQDPPEQSLGMVQVSEGGITLSVVVGAVDPAEGVAVGKISEVKVGLTSPIVDGQPAGIVQVVPVQSLGMVQVSVAEVVMGVPIEVVEVNATSPVDEIHPAGIVQVSPEQSLGIVQVSTGVVASGVEVVN